MLTFDHGGARSLSELRAAEVDNDTDISHHGIKGMKWGVRRYQNPDGTYTNEGKKHRSSSGINAKKALKVGAKVVGVAGLAGLAAGAYALSSSGSDQKLVADCNDAYKEAVNLEQENLRIGKEERERIKNPKLSRKEIDDSYKKVSDAAEKSIAAERRAARLARDAEHKNLLDEDSEISIRRNRIVGEYTPHDQVLNWLVDLNGYHPDVAKEYSIFLDEWIDRKAHRVSDVYGNS